MHDVTGLLELSSLNSEIAAAYLKSTEDEISTVVEKLGDCLRLIRELRNQSTIVEHNLKQFSNLTDPTLFRGD